VGNLYQEHERSVDFAADLAVDPANVGTREQILNAARGCR
jgi:hypothetical protein